MGVRLEVGMGGPPLHFVKVLKLLLTRRGQFPNIRLTQLARIGWCRRLRAVSRTYTTGSHTPDPATREPYPLIISTDQWLVTPSGLKIKPIKAVADVRRGKLLRKLAKEITIAARMGDRFAKIHA